MKNVEKYQRSYYMPPQKCINWASREYIEHAPIWCSVDLRDGNQALIEPMGLDEKLAFFHLLVKIGFKEIEVGFPAASETEYQFLRALIDQKMIPEDVTIQVLMQSREHIIRKSFEALKGVPRAIMHLYNSTSAAQREQVFKKDKNEIKMLAVQGAKLMKELAEETEGKFLFEYSPESFTGTEPEYALEVCNSVLDIWKPEEGRKAIINLPSTVEHSMPHVFASQVEYISSNLNHRENVILSLHPHNDRGCSISDAEMGLLAGADRIEGTLFGNGERTGNVDIITLAMNMYSQGIDPMLDFSEMPSICEKYTQYTNMRVYERQPYSGSLVFAAFSGSHQDAIAKGLEFRKEQDLKKWTVPYLPIDPEDIGRQYDADVIRINSQSGKGGVGYILENNYGIILPKKMKENMGYAAKDVSDKHHKELSPEWVYNIFLERYIENHIVFDITEVHYKQQNGILAEVTLVMKVDGQSPVHIEGRGNGRLDAVSNALKRHFGFEYEINCYEEHSLSVGSDSKACAYVGITMQTGSVFYGAGIHEDIITAPVNALVSALNAYMQKG